jgi:acyl carrier protein
MIPARFARIDALPLNHSGKLDRAALPDPWQTALPETQGLRLPTTPTEVRFAAIVAEAIGRDDFGIDDDFFLLGGHSLLGTQVIVKARQAFGVELTLLHLFEARTVARLAAVVEDLAAAHLASLSDADIARLMRG